MKWRTCTCYSVVVTSPLWAQELSFEHLLEIARTHTDRQRASFLPKRVSGFCLPIVAMPSQSYNQPFGMPLSAHNRYMDSAEPRRPNRKIFRLHVNPNLLPPRCPVVSLSRIYVALLSLFDFVDLGHRAKMLPGPRRVLLGDVIVFPGTLQIFLGAFW